MGQKIEELQRAGRHDDAEMLARRLRDLRNRLQAEARPRGDANELEQVLHGLEMGRDAARRIGDAELAVALQRAMERVKQRARGQQVEDRDGAERERHEARRQIEVLQMARGSLAEGERHDAVDMIDRAIRARELALEGRRDEEGGAMRWRAPDREQLARILGMSAELWADFDHEQKARTVGELARRLAGRERPDAEAGAREQEGQRDRERGEEQERERVRAREAAMERERTRGREESVEVEERAQEHGHGQHELHQRLQELMRRMEALQQQIEELRRRR
jgi:hypothetical protein